jgi:broad specificity phosphatase PhoE
MRKLILIRHSLPEIDPDVAPREWPLSDEGRRRCEKLARRLNLFSPDIFVSSVEAKAMETARIAADCLGKPYEVAEGLHEHDRTGEPFGTQAEFEAKVAEFFDRPGTLVFGRETADQAHSRYAGALDEAVSRYQGQSVAIVAHGTVMTLFISRALHIDPFPFWKRLGLPAFVVLSWPGLKLGKVVERVR